MVLSFREWRVEDEPGDAEYVSVRDILSTRLTIFSRATTAAGASCGTGICPSARS
jgi:hypothetical protein